MAVASDLPQLEDRAQFADAQNSVVNDINGKQITTLTNNEGRILINSGDIAPVMKEATVAIEDQRFYEHRGVDFQGIGRASSRTSSTPARPREARRSPSSSSRTRSRPRAAEPSSRSFARPRSPTSSSATGTRTRSSPSTSTRSTSARAHTGSRRRPRPTSAGITPAAERHRTAARPSYFPGRRRRCRA